MPCRFNQPLPNPAPTEFSDGFLAPVGLAVLVVLAAAGCGTSSSEATFVVSENSCKTLKTFTRAEVIAMWGKSAVKGEELRGTPAAIDAECAAHKHS